MLNVAEWIIATLHKEHKVKEHKVKGHKVKAKVKGQRSRSTQASTLDCKEMFATI